MNNDPLSQQDVAKLFQGFYDAEKFSLSRGVPSLFGFKLSTVESYWLSSLRYHRAELSMARICMDDELLVEVRISQ